MTFLIFLITTALASTISITGNLAKIDGTNTVVSLDQIADITHEIPLIDPKLAKTEEERTWIKLHNLEAKWISGKRYTYIKGVKVELSLVQEIEIIKYQARKRIGLNGPALEDDERELLELKLKEIQAAVDKQVDSVIFEERFKPKTTSTSHNVDAAVHKASTQGGGNLFVVVLDGLPYLLDNLPSGNIAEYKNMILSIKSNLGLTCNLPTTPPAHNGLKLKLDGHYASLSYFAYMLQNDIFIADTIENTAFCDKDTSKIFANGFESTGAQ